MLYYLTYMPILCYKFIGTAFRVTPIRFRALASDFIERGYSSGVHHNYVYLIQLSLF